MSKLLPHSMLSVFPAIVFLLLGWHCPGSFGRGSASFGGSTRRVKHPLEEEDMGMPISHPAVMIPLIGAIIMITAVVCGCCMKLLNGNNENDKKNVPEVERLQLGRKPRSRSRTPELRTGLANGAKCDKQDKPKNNHLTTNMKKQKVIENDDLPFDCYRPVAATNNIMHRGEQLV